MLIALIILSILLTGFFAGIEIAFASANKFSIELRKKQGVASGIIWSRFVERPSRFIGVCLIGFNVSLVTCGLLVTRGLDRWWWQRMNLPQFVMIILDILIGFSIVLLTEFTFKAIFRARPDGALQVFGGLVNFFDGLFGWLAKQFVSLSHWVLKYIFNVQIDDQKPLFSRVDLEHYYQQTREMDEDSQELNTELFENALSLPSVRIRSCLVPRKEIVGVDIKQPVETVVQKMIETKLSKLIVYDGGIDNIVGYVHQLDLFKNPPDIRSVLLPIPAVPETMSATDLISKLSQERRTIAWVVDEFGGTAGIVTMEDVLEELFGEIHDEYDTEEFVDKQLSENEYMFSGRMELDTLREKYALSFPDAEMAETLSGYIINQHETMPKQAERIIIGDYQFDIMNMADTRIELVKVKVLG